MTDWSLAEQRLLVRLLGGAVSADASSLKAASRLAVAGLVEVSEQSTTRATLTDEGAEAAEKGLPERRAIELIQQAGGGGLPMGDMMGQLGAAGKVAVGWLKKKGWASIEQGRLVAQGEAPPGPDETLLTQLAADPDAPWDEDAGAPLAQRGLVHVEDFVQRSIALTEAGKTAAQSIDAAILDQAQEINQVTPAVLAAWSDWTPEQRASAQLRGFGLDADVAPRHPGKAHPLTHIIQEIRDIFVSLGFQEIMGDYVESAFWNMDALFIPQDHPARDMQDTFYLDAPATLDVADADLERGKEIHETGGETGSTGWGPGFDPAVSQMALLRTHTTNTTVRFLAENPKQACKVFGIGKVFRKETMDATHLPEFYQIEGIVTEPGANFNMLVGLCKEFFTRMGFPEVRFRPAYFPYTEPSMEIDVLYNGKWMELGGCGVFRPEVTEPLDVPDPVLAWGLGLERLAMMRLGLKDIRDLYVSDIKWLQETPL